jgi:hypothetical protein
VPWNGVVSGGLGFGDLTIAGEVIVHFTAQVLPGSRAMLGVFARALTPT